MCSQCLTNKARTLLSHYTSPVPHSEAELSTHGSVWSSGEQRYLSKGFKEKVHFLLLPLLAAWAILNRDLSSGETLCCCWCQPWRAELSVMRVRGGVGWGKHILLTVKQTSGLAEHCRENDITAEF